MRDKGSNRVWTIGEAKARLSEILRLAEEGCPRRIGICVLPFRFH